LTAERVREKVADDLKVEISNNFSPRLLRALRGSVMSAFI